MRSMKQNRSHSASAVRLNGVPSFLARDALGAYRGRRSDIRLEHMLELRFARLRPVRPLATGLVACVDDDFQFMVVLLVVGKTDVAGGGSPDWFS